jgi:hypothetical protein
LGSWGAAVTAGPCDEATEGAATALTVGLGDSGAGGNGSPPASNAAGVVRPAPIGGEGDVAVVGVGVGEAFVVMVSDLRGPAEARGDAEVIVPRRE